MIATHTPSQIRSPMRHRREMETRWLKRLYEIWPIGQEVQTAVDRLIPQFEQATPSKLGHAFQLYGDAGIIDKKMAYIKAMGLPGKAPFPTGEKTIRQWIYKLTMPYDAALAALNTYWDKVYADAEKPHAPRTKKESNGHTYAPYPETPWGLQQPVEPKSEPHNEALARQQAQAQMTSRISVRGPASTNPPRQNEKFGASAADAAAALAEHERRQNAAAAEELRRAKIAEAMREDAADQQRLAREGAAASVALAHDEAEETRAIAGPEAKKSFEALRPLRKATDPEAAVAAARQYANRYKPIDDLIKTLNAQGVRVNRELMLDSVNYERDEFLETIGLVLPYIDRIEASLERATARNTEVGSRFADYDQNKRDLERSRAANTRLVSENTALREELARRPKPRE